MVGDVEGGIALHWLAKLFERKGETEQAAAAYRQYIMDTEGRGISDRDQQSRAYRFIAEYSLRKGERARERERERERDVRGIPPRRRGRGLRKKAKGGKFADKQYRFCGQRGGRGSKNPKILKVLLTSKQKFHFSTKSLY